MNKAQSMETYLMNKAQRIAAAKRIQKNSDDNWPTAPADRAELLTLLADAERENDELREYANHKPDCKKWRVGAATTYTQKCNCGLDELLSKQESE